MTLRVIYRSYGGENYKSRPAYYSKMLGLLSFLRAVERVDSTVVFLNDGPMPEDRLRVMRQAGQVVTLPGVGMQKSYLTAFQHAAESEWADDDVVWFGEDDYLYLPESFQELERATQALTFADYFALTGAARSHPVRPAGWQDLPPWTVGDQEWLQIYSTTSTFGGRLRAVRQDMGIFRFCTVPHRHMLRDHDTGLVLQGVEPHHYRDLGRAAVGLVGDTPRQRLRQAALAPFLLATNLRAHRRPDRRRLLLAVQPNLATHMEDGFIIPGVDWSEVAADTWRWALERPQTGAPLVDPRTSAGD